MNDVSPVPESTVAGPPPGFKPIRLMPIGSFAEVNGPLYRKIVDGKLTVGFRVEARHCNPAGNCHGGMLMTFGDMLLGMGSNFAEKLARFLPTISMTSDFLAPAPLGCWVEGHTEVLRVTRNMVFAQAMITADGTPALRVSGILKLGVPFDHESLKGMMRG